MSIIEIDKQMLSSEKLIKTFDDQPLSSAKLFNFDTYAKALAATISENSQAPLVIGIFGEWGSGKTSLMRTVESRIKNLFFLEDIDQYLFNWDDIPGNDNVRLIEFLKKKFGIDWLETAEIEKIDDFMTIRVFTEKKSLSLKLNNEYLFSWDDIPENDNVRLIEFLKKKFGIDWLETAIIEKIDDSMTIRVFTEKRSLSLKLNDDKTIVNLEIDNVRTDEFIMRTENGRLNIYDKTKVNLEIDDGRTDEFIVRTENGY